MSYSPQKAKDLLYQLDLRLFVVQLFLHFFKIFGDNLPAILSWKKIKIWVF